MRSTGSRSVSYRLASRLDRAGALDEPFSEYFAEPLDTVNKFFTAGQHRLCALSADVQHVSARYAARRRGLAG